MLSAAREPAGVALRASLTGQTWADRLTSLEGIQPQGTSLQTPKKRPRFGFQIGAALSAPSLTSNLNFRVSLRANQTGIAWAAGARMATSPA